LVTKRFGDLRRLFFVWILLKDPILLPWSVILRQWVFILIPFGGMLPPPGGSPHAPLKPEGLVGGPLLGPLPIQANPVAPSFTPHLGEITIPTSDWPAPFFFGGASSPPTRSSIGGLGVAWLSLVGLELWGSDRSPSVGASPGRYFFFRFPY